MTTTIIASGAEVRAWLAGSTQFRRPVKPQPVSVERWKHGFPTDDTDARYATLRDATGKGWTNCGPWRIPWKPGDVLRVRESHRVYEGRYEEGDRYRTVLYRADDGEPATIGWRSAATMPAWASRMSIRVTGVGIERGDVWQWVVNFERVEVV